MTGQFNVWSKAISQWLSRLGLAPLCALVFVLLICPRLLSAAFPGLWNWTASNADIGMYFANAQFVLDGKIPYRDFIFEYPPLAFAAELIPSLITKLVSTNPRWYVAVFIAMNAIAASLLIRDCEQLSGIDSNEQRGAVRLKAMLAFALMAPFIAARLDIILVFLILSSAKYLMRGSFTRAQVLLASSVLFKIVPIILSPLYLLMIARRSSWGQSVKSSAYFGITLVLCLGLGMWIIGPEFWSFLRFHSARSLQVESVPGAFLLLISPEARTSLSYNYGADHIMSASALSIAQMLPILSIVVLGSVIVWMHRYLWRAAPSGISSRLLIEFSLILFCVFILCSKVFSPQYCMWLFPGIILLHDRRLLWLSFVILFVTSFTFMFLYAQLLDGELWVIALVNIRNLLLVVFSAFLVRTVAARLRSGDDDLRLNAHQAPST